MQIFNTLLLVAVAVSAAPATIKEPKQVSESPVPQATQPPKVQAPRKVATEVVQAEATATPTPQAKPPSPCTAFGLFSCAKDTRTLYQCGYTEGNVLSWRLHSQCGTGTVCVDNGPNGFVGCQVASPSQVHGVEQGEDAVADYHYYGGRGGYGGYRGHPWRDEDGEYGRGGEGGGYRRDSEGTVDADYHSHGGRGGHDGYEGRGRYHGGHEHGSGSGGHRRDTEGNVDADYHSHGSYGGHGGHGGHNGYEGHGGYHGGHEHGSGSGGYRRDVEGNKQADDSYSSGSCYNGSFS
ncbi:hypothetical protein BCR33DRAFT_848045 [Rhizoclosmatium globosum]|uniref:Carbohydrate-binding module family 19 domain-containing protein n=1 Tax=Rhizoclosmatium globosum TaxID=329046 RepID=A0A1Y2CP05_9FUNG|nr:hypothetical protein BCR33DRAFT_848045 [Rhizoclosmatium globosum]|eukprot:ORY48686.1 hypothetical protein BCR33DRAFT_848045 [Rhizoclosmatium globosum]